MPKRGPYKITKDAQTTVVNVLRGGADMALAAQAIGVTRAGLYLRMKKDAEFRSAVDEARGIADDRVVSALFRSATNGNVTAMIFWLKNRQPNNWADSYHHRMAGMAREVTVTFTGGSNGHAKRIEGVTLDQELVEAVNGH